MPVDAMQLNKILAFLLFRHGPFRFGGVPSARGIARRSLATRTLVGRHARRKHEHNNTNAKQKHCHKTTTTMGVQFPCFCKRGKDSFGFLPPLT